MPPDRKADAVMVPRGRYRAPLGPEGVAQFRFDTTKDSLKAEFGDRMVLSPKGSLYVRAPHGGGEFYFATGDPDDSLEYPVGHPWEKQGRYDWFVLEDGSNEPRQVDSWRKETDKVKFGWLREDPFRVGASPTARAAADAEVRDAYGNSYARMLQIRAKGILATEDENRELKAIDEAARARMNAPAAKDTKKGLTRNG